MSKVDVRSDGLATFQQLKPVELAGRAPLRANEIDQIAKHYKSGKSVRQVAAIMGLHRQTVSQHLQSRGIARRGCKRSLTDTQCVDIADKYVAGCSLSQLGREYGVDAKTVRKELGKLGVNIRQSGEVVR